MALLWEQLWLPFPGFERDAFTGLATFPFGENIGRPADDPERHRGRMAELPNVGTADLERSKWHSQHEGVARDEANLLGGA
jgi:hypothetical protein